MPDSDDATSALLNGFLKALLADVAVAHGETRTTSSQLVRRNFVRCVFAAIEGVNFDLRQRCLKRQPSPFSEAEVFLLREESFALNGKGQPYSRPMYFPLEDSLKFTFRMYCSLLPTAPQIDFSGAGWEALRKSITIRHRLTHPKSASSLDLSIEDISTVTDAYVWYMRTLMINLLDGIDAYRVQIDAIRSELGKDGASGAPN